MTHDLAPRIAALAALDDVPAYLDGVLDLLQSATRADIAYLAAGRDVATTTPRWSHCRPPDAGATVQDVLSTTVMHQSLERGESILSPCALLDPRFRDRASVRRNRIETVLCVPIGTIGLVYLHSRTREPFTPDDLALVEQAAALVTPALARLVQGQRLDAPDATAVHRRRLRAPELVGTSPALASVLEHLAVCARTRAPVLLTGETGTGKSTIARVLHENSGRRGPLVTVECTQLRAERLIADLFGARAGSYTGITRDKPGLVETAHQGTLFLDEVGELDPEAQGQLLRFLQDGRYRWLGDPRDREARDVRVVTATNVDLEEAVQTGSFREDLYYRLAVFPVRVPPLRERLDDLPFLAHDLLWKASEDLGVPNLPLAPSALTALDARSWPGNLRELDNVLRKGLLWATADGSAALQAAHLDRSQPTPPATEATLAEAVATFKRRKVLAALDAEGGNRTRAARRLGIGRSSLYELLAGYGL